MHFQLWVCFYTYITFSVDKLKTIIEYKRRIMTERFFSKRKKEYIKTHAICINHMQNAILQWLPPEFENMVPKFQLSLRWIVFAWNASFFLSIFCKVFGRRSHKNLLKTHSELCTQFARLYRFFIFGRKRMRNRVKSFRHTLTASLCLFFHY